MTPFRFLLGIFLFASYSLSAQFNANWVTHPQLKGSEQAVVLFRTTFELEGMPDSFPIDISADAHFRLHVNGEWVSWGATAWRYPTLAIRPS